ncbi:MAG: hypothetical protein A2017_18825 [Lentisphaerae bacterium GWF2_44_16]|nr:MAG: hypothetical protein A2017_18825 [Lentisphaerae bacterium GWF2_44_16]
MAEKKEKNISIMSYIGLAILLVCYLGAIWNVLKVKNEEIDKTTIRLCHWQLEAGYRDAMDEMIKLYEKTHPKVKIIQIPITERAYGQWVTTQLLGRTAPDLIEIGGFDTKLYLGRYFVPLTDELRKPNPYNKDNPLLRNVPWMDTFVDSLQGSYMPDLLDYYMVGMNQGSVRIFYNKDIFRRILKTDKEPKTLSEFLNYCKKIQNYVAQKNAEAEKYNQKVMRNLKWWQKLPFAPLKLKEKAPLVPIASNRYNINTYKGRYLAMFTADKYLELDVNFDGSLKDGRELLLAFLNGDLTFDDPKMEAGIETVRDMAKYFAPGFMSIERMDSGFAFVQGRAAFITSGSWDAKSFIGQASSQPFGDIILAVNGKKVSSSDEIMKTMNEAVAAKKDISLLLNREGSKIKVNIKPLEGKKHFRETFGFELADIKDTKLGKVPVITELESVSPAEDAGLMPRKRFEVGIFDFPVPGPNDKYAKYIAGPVAEVSRTGCAYGITKFSKHKETAIDFLQFCTTPENNQKFNEIVEWIPAVKYAKTIEMLKPFEPNFKGYFGSLNFSFGGKTRSAMIESQVYWPYISGEIDYKEYLKKLKSSLPQDMAYDFDAILVSASDALPDKQLQRSIYLAKYIFSKDNAGLEESRRKLKASWDVIIDYSFVQPATKAMFAPFFANPDKTEFSKSFFENFKRIKTRRD